MTHRGPTLGFRIEDAGRALCYLPDHEPAIVGRIDELEPQWISGYALANQADLLLHDCQYTDQEYPSHFGWGHSSVSQVLRFAERCDVNRTVLFHHDPYHTDEQLDAIAEAACQQWRELSRDRGSIAMAVEGSELSVDAPFAELDGPQ